MFRLPLEKELESSRNIIISGCGGGYDFFGGLPIYWQLKTLGKTVYLTNLSFTQHIPHLNGKRYPSDKNWCIEVTPDTTFQKGFGSISQYYFPELLVSKWMKENEKEDVPVYTFDRSIGPKPMRIAFQALIDEKSIDTVILLDNGTDSLMFGDEFRLGSPNEDMTSMSALHGIKNVKKLLLNLGFGVDTFHGVNHFRYLENVSKVIKQGGFLGAFSLLKDHEEAKKLENIYLDCQPENSIVTSSVLSAVKGEFGNHHHEKTKHRTQFSELFISPLMSLYWCFYLDVVCENVIYINDIMDAETHDDVGRAIFNARKDLMDKKTGSYIGKRPDKVIPQ